MGKKAAALTTRMWALLRLALLWARKGGAFKRSLLSGVNFLKGLRMGRSSRFNDSYQIRDGDMELSFGDTPVFRLGGSSSRRPFGSMRLILSSLPCVKRPTTPSDSFDDEHAGISGEAFFRRSYSEIGDNEGEDQEFESTEWVEGPRKMPVEDEDEGVDARAEEFIAKFYRQMKLQRQVSLLQYQEMVNRGT